MSKKRRFRSSEAFGQSMPEQEAAPPAAAASLKLKKKKKPAQRSPSGYPPVWVRLLVSLGLLWHLAALFVVPLASVIASQSSRAIVPGGGVFPPANFQPEKREPETAEKASVNNKENAPDKKQTAQSFAPVLEFPPLLKMRKIFTPYLDALHLNPRGQFFSPDPGPSHILAYRIEKQDGKIETGTFPDKKTERPRLLYHRYYLLASQGIGLVPAQKQPLKPELNSAGPLATQAQPKPYDPFAAPRAYARYLLKTKGGLRIQLRGVEHALLTPNQVRAGAKLDADWTYLEWPGRWGASWEIHEKLPPKPIAEKPPAGQPSNNQTPTSSLPSP